MPGALARAIRTAGAAAPEGAGCDLCGEPAPVGHRHLLDTERAEVMCACRACALLFAGPGTGAGHYRLIPRRRVRLPPVPTAPLGVPVGLAFFVPRADGSVTAHYPSPAGATRWEVDATTWRRTTAGHPGLAGLASDVEALLVNTARGQCHHWIVPVDDCFRVVAVVRAEWEGLSGGTRVWQRVEQFFAELTGTPD
ncbi:DUF5947 family protein [Streptantibioticus cattleyicolor]|uniref:Uncharacterized protein n=1 Tax=Streptantibioticus cattleyicolor (strain ATCC 35852 / DSM 46488 / JCM 4925 / NBRC 14057 / NRRL 8057) TaxID=1003195 RepID=F8JM40_STREN|nr:DUF5947 family protein [Streptantibioticus cattleyicolor]AEW99438.1 hypothetical protein SCATT_p12450 [Streptantibioticus cattleyicolor NRRL 8057 = DSM 46488]CCB71522.1 conserved protein of unknown function [Streptantibioticus cattleyicolor NRRL 8057 = DSM 46488]